MKVVKPQSTSLALNVWFVSAYAGEEIGRQSGETSTSGSD
jgi:hypothetical protein